MAISKEKMKIVINNYFKAECDVNTSIREAFEKGFRIGVEKGYVQARTEQTEWNCAVCEHFRSKTEEATEKCIYCYEGSNFQCVKTKGEKR